MNIISEIDTDKPAWAPEGATLRDLKSVAATLDRLGFPLPEHGGEWPLTEEEIWIIRQELAREFLRGQVGAPVPFEKLVHLRMFGPDHKALLPSDYEKLYQMESQTDERLRWLRADRDARQRLEAEDLAAARGPRTKRTAAEFADIPPPPVIMREVLAAEMNLVGGPSEAGKSLLARDWALAVATGTPWQGHRVSEARNVLWVASEGLHDFAERFTSQPAWTDAKNQIFVLDVPVDLVHGNDVEWLLDEYKVERPGLVVFDVIYGMGMADDNGSRDVFPVIKAMKKISEAWGAATLALGHPPHGDARRMRGSSAWRQLTYTEWHMAGGSLSCEKSKIADKRRLSATYEVQYPDLRWLSMGEAVTNAVERHLIIQRDIEAYPDDNDSARARRLEPVLNMGDRQIKRYIKTVKDGLP